MYQNKFWTLCLGLSLLIGICSQQSFSAEPVVIFAEGEYVMGEGETMEVAAEKAKKAAMQAAAEQAGVYVKSYTQVINLVLESDVIETIANHAMKVEVVDQKRSVVGDVEAIRFYVKIKATMTEEEIEANLQKIREDQSIVDAYSRLKADYDRQNKEMEILKTQLANAVGGDRQKIARLISEEERKYKANLWLEKAQQSSSFSEDGLIAYKKALEFDPELAEAYVGIADWLIFQNMGESYDLNEMENKLRSRQEALANLDHAISLDEYYADAYAKRAEVLKEIRDTEIRLHEWKEDAVDYDAIKKQYNDRLIKDINRAIALDASDKADLYQKRAYFFVDAAIAAEYDQFPADAIEGFFDKAIADIDQAVALCKEGEPERLVPYYQTKASIYRNKRNYYIRKDDSAGIREAEELASLWTQEAEELTVLNRTAYEKEEKDFEEFQKTTEMGKLSQELELGWRDRIPGYQELREHSLEEQERDQERWVAGIRKRIDSGTALAEEHLFLAMFDFDAGEEIRRDNFDRGIALLENRNPRGREALLLMNFYLYQSRFRVDHEWYDQALDGLGKAKMVTDKYLPGALELFDWDAYWCVMKQMIESGQISEDLTRLDREQAEGWFWLGNAFQISTMRADIYEKLDLPKKALEEYRYLCEVLKYENACKDMERLK